MGIVSGILVLWLAFSSLSRADGLPPDTVSKIEVAIKAAQEKLRIPGLSVAVVVDGRPVWSRGFGLADVENEVSATPETVYRLASVSKPITAVAAMQLYEKGKLNLDADVRRYVPSFPEKKWTVTPRQLLGHLGGIRHYKGGDEEINSTRHYFGDVLRPLRIFQNDPLEHEPGTQYLYSTYGYNLLGAAAEGAAGTSYLNLIRTGVFEPAGMTHARADNVFEIIPHRAQGYRLQNGRLANSALADTSNKIPGGGLCATADDLAAFASALMNGKLVKDETRELMFTSQKTSDGKPTGYGMGWSVARRDGHREVSHSGAQQRVSTMLYLRPDEKVAVVILSNLEGVGNGLGALARQIADVLPSESTAVIKPR